MNNFFCQLERIKKDATANAEWKKECEEMLKKQKKESEEKEKKHQEEMKKLKEDAERDRREAEARMKRIEAERAEFERGRIFHGSNVHRRNDETTTILIFGPARIS